MHILVINGSTRTKSTNGLFIEAIIKLAGDRLQFKVYPSVADLPHFNPDLDVDPASPQVAQFRKLLHEADAVLICTPEYAMGVPGSLKNALDWTVSSADLRLKPTMLVTASLSGERAQVALLGTLLIIEAVITGYHGAHSVRSHQSECGGIDHRCKSARGCAARIEPPARLRSRLIASSRLLRARTMAYLRA